jgi:3-oxoacyl-[acyl-carrier-protein] synthase II
VVAAKANFGNLGAGSGLVECIASLLALRHGTLFPLLNYRSPDPECAIHAAEAGDAAGESFVSSSITPQGQAGAVVIGGWNLGA